MNVKNTTYQNKPKTANMPGALKGLLEGKDGKRLLKYATKLCRNGVEAEELLQDACYRALRAQAQFDASEPLIVWVGRILRNAFYDACKYRSRRFTLDAPVEIGAETPRLSFLADGEGSTEDVVSRGETREAVSRAFSRLRPRVGEVVALCDVGGLSYDEAASRLQIPVGTVRSRLARGRAALRRALGQVEAGGVLS